MPTTSAQDSVNPDLTSPPQRAGKRRKREGDDTSSLGHLGGFGDGPPSATSHQADTGHTDKDNRPDSDHEASDYESASETDTDGVDMRIRHKN
ncbi:hypothetical protein DFQ27_002119, partial [Actinomortierella ambigua]